jgi:hypothetical protein
VKKLPGILVLLAGICLWLPAAAQVDSTFTWTDFYGTVTYNGQPAPIGTVVDAYDPDGVHCGTFTVGDITDSVGIFGFLPVYGDDPFTAGVDEGANAGETISFKVNGRDATVESGDPTWDAQTVKEISLSAGGAVAFSLVDFEDVKVGAPGDTVRFTIGVRNDGDGLDYYGVTSTSVHGWTTIDLDTPAYADPLDTAYVYFDVEIPVFGPDQEDTVNFSVFSYLDPATQVDNAYVIRSQDSGRVIAFTITEIPNDATGQPGDVISFQIGVRNDGSDMDYYGVTTSAIGDWETVDPSYEAAGIDDTVYLTFDVIIPASPLTRLTDTISYTLFSWVDPAESFDSSVIVNIPLDPTTVMTVVDPPVDASGAPGQTVRFNIAVRNSGTGVDIYGVTSTSKLGWTTVDKDSTFAAPTYTENVYFDVTIPTDAGDAVDSIIYTVFSRVDASQQYVDTVALTSEVIYAMTAIDLPGDQTGVPDDSIRFEVGVRNDGNVPDLYAMEVTSAKGWVTSNADSITNNPTETAYGWFDVFIPADAGNAVDTISYSIYSYNDGSQRYDGTVILTSNPATIIVVTGITFPTDRTAGPGDTVSFTVDIYNGGNVTDIYGFDIQTTLAWEVFADDSVSNPPGDTAQMMFDVVIPDDALTASDTIDFRLFSYVDTSQHISGTVVLSNISTGIADNNGALPDEYALAQNFPNPFNPTTTIAYALPGKSQVTLQVINVLGQFVDTRSLGTVPAGNHRVEYDGSRLASGVYFYRLVTDFGAETRKMVLLK